MADKDGHHVFAVTYDQHQANVAAGAGGRRPRVITGRTRVAAVIGHPVEHSLSPAMHNAGFASLGVDWVYVAFDVAPGGAVAALAGMRALGIAGLSVTMPHKEDVAAAVDVLDPAAAALRSVNTVVALRDGRLAGHSTDGDGFVASLGAGGCAIAGRVGVRPRRRRRGAVDRRRVGRARCGAGRGGQSVRRAARRSRRHSLVHIGRVGSLDDVVAADIVVNATSVGMGDARTALVPLSCLRGDQVVADIVYHPRRTALLDVAESAGATTIDGLGMLVHQAALQQDLWTGRTPDVAAMRAAAERELAAREASAR